jgi:peptidoglycan/LPS O-acetylase OafA/YrhL
MGTLRLILAVVVAYSHLAGATRLPTSDIAVQSFFVISGFYMALVLRSKYPPGTYWLFISNRLLRLWPAYLLVLTASLAVATNWPAVAKLDRLGIAFFAITQLLIVGQDIYLFLFVHGDHLQFTAAHLDTVGTPFFVYAPVPQAWSLGPEIYFYLLAPFLVRRGPLAIAGLIAASLAVRMGLQAAFGFDGNPWSFRFFPSELALFLAGTLGHSAYAAATAAERQLAQRLLIATSLLIFVCLTINGWNGPLRLASVALLSAVVLGIPRLFDLTRTMAMDRYIGELSYPFYICHFLAGWLLMPGDLASAYSALALSLLMSVALYHFVDRPIDQWRQTRYSRRGRPVTAPAAIGLTPA